MKQTHGMTTSDFYCVKCGQKGIPVVRRPGGQREAGHLKKLFCLHCKEEVNHVEIRPFGTYTYEDFQLEYELGRFKDEQRVPVSELVGCSKEDCHYNIDGKCWNANGTYQCPHKIS